MRITRTVLRSMFMAVFAFVAGVALAHEPVARCSAVDATTIRCQGAYSDGSSAADAKMEVIAHDGRVLASGKLDRDSAFVFVRPQQPFYVLLDVGPGHMVVIEHDEIM